MITLDDIAQLVNSKSSITLKVVDTSFIFDESYAEKGMIAVITKALPTVTLPNGDVDMYMLTIDWAKFSDINTPLEAQDWNIPNSKLLGTMRDAGCYPENGIEELYFGASDFSGFALLEQNDNEALILQAWNNLDTKPNFQDFLYSLAATALRTNANAR